MSSEFDILYLWNCLEHVNFFILSWNMGKSQLHEDKCKLTKFFEIFGRSFAILINVLLTAIWSILPSMKYFSYSPRKHLEWVLVLSFFQKVLKNHPTQLKVVFTVENIFRCTFAYQQYFARHHQKSDEFFRRLSHHETNSINEKHERCKLT